MKHLVRAGVLLAVVLIFVFVVLRAIPATEPLAKLGFHKKDVAADREKWASLTASFVSTSLCVDCHQGEFTLWQGGDHRGVSCENCHGPARAHLEVRARPVVDTSRELCGTCHARVEGRPARFPQVDMNEMGAGAACITCHNPP